MDAAPSSPSTAHAQVPVRPARSRALEDPLMARIDQLLQKGFPLLNFLGALEDQFLRDMLDARRRHFLFSGLVALLLYNGFLIADYLMTPDVFDLAIRLRLFYLTPLALFLIFMGTRPNWAIVRNTPPVMYEVIIVGFGLLAAASLAAVLARTHSPYAHFYHVGFSVVIMYGNIATRLRFWYAVIFSLAVMGIHTYGVMQALQAFPPRLVAPIVTLVATTALFSLVANYTMERDERRRYLLMLRERGVVRELSQTYERLQTLAHIDGLTGLYNRRHFQEHLENVWGRAQYDKEVVSVMMVDIDHFKRYNDRYGHAAGDECLVKVAQAMQDVVRRPEDLTARYGGEEFIALMPYTDLAQAMKTAERVRQAVEALQLRHESSSASHFVTVSVGVACVRADFALKDAVLISAADHALQQAKREGRNRVCFHDRPVSPASSASSPQPTA
ncbi:MAG: diguanylate cyclase [Aquabacterium sp.]